MLGQPACARVAQPGPFRTHIVRPSAPTPARPPIRSPAVESALLDGVDGLDLGPCPGDAAGAALLRAVAASHGPAPVTGAALAAQAAGEAPLPTGIEG